MQVREKGKKALKILRITAAFAAMIIMTAACMPQAGPGQATAEEASGAATTAVSEETGTGMTEEAAEAGTRETEAAPEEEETSRVTEGPRKGMKAGRIFNTQKNELDEFTGGEPGDQTGHETRIDKYALYYRTPDYPWTCLLHCTDPELAERAADLAALTAANDLVGYDSGSLMTTFWDHLAASCYDPAQITIACSANCATSILSIYKAAGYQLGIEALQGIDHSGNASDVPGILMATGLFEKVTDEGRLHSPDHNHAGDVYVAPGRHVILQVTDGRKAD